MTDIAFHFNVAEPLDYGCRLLRKALRSGSRVAVTAEPARLAELDQLLWTFEPLEFVPHWRAARAAALPERLRDTPVLLLDEPSPELGHRVLVNLGSHVPEAYPQFDRVIEIVGQAPEDRGAARERWRRYSADGRSIERHEVRA